MLQYLLIQIIQISNYFLRQIPSEGIIRIPDTSDFIIFITTLTRCFQESTSKYIKGTFYAHQLWILYFICIYVYKVTQISKITMQISIPYRAELTPFKWEHTFESYIHADGAVTWLKYPQDLSECTNFSLPTLLLGLAFYDKED